MKSMTFAEENINAAEIAVEYFRDLTIVAFNSMTEGLPQQYRAAAFRTLKFFEQETSAETWQRLSAIPDPDNPGQSIGQSWIADWERLSQAVGRDEDDGYASRGPQDRERTTDPTSPTGY